MSQAVGSILTPDGWVAGTVWMHRGRISHVTGSPDLHPDPPFVLPGFIDLHVHGGGGDSCMAGAEALRRMLRFHGARGTTALAPTTVAADPDAVRDTLATVAHVRHRPQPGEAAVLGAHLEGPFINPARLGSQPNRTLAGDPALADAWASDFPLVIATVAPEIAQGLEVIRALAQHDCRVQIGHSVAGDAVCAAAVACGCTGYTHLFNAMSGVAQRAEGVASFALAHADHAEIICDLVHVLPTVIHAARRAIPGLYAVTDAASAAGLPDGAYEVDGRPIVKRDGRITLTDGTTLAGSAITMADALRNLVAIGVSLEEASHMTATRQADYLGLRDLGRIEPGARACLVRLDARLAVEAVWIDGETVPVAA